jgi:hypothetical protein
VVEKQCAFHELATVKASERYFAAKIELITLKPFARSSVKLISSAPAPQTGGMNSEGLIFRDFGMNGGSDHLLLASTISVQEP